MAVMMPMRYAGTLRISCPRKSSTSTNQSMSCSLSSVASSGDERGQLLGDLGDVHEVVDDDDLGGDVTELGGQFGRGEHDLGGARGALRGADVGGLDVGVLAERAQGLLGVHLQQHR